MLNRRTFLERSLKTSSLFAVGATVPGFVANAAVAVAPGKDRILVIVELSGGNDGLNTVVPFGDDEYHKARPAIGLKKRDTIRIGDGIGLNNALSGLSGLQENGQLAVVQGVGYPNPNRSHFESMDVWHTADPKGKRADGWLGRGLTLVKSRQTGIPAFHLGEGKLPLALKGSSSGVPTLNTGKPFGLELGEEAFGRDVSEFRPQRRNRRDSFFSKEEAKETHTHSAIPRVAAHKKLIHDIAGLSAAGSGDLQDFVRQTSLETYTSIDRLKKLMKADFNLTDEDGRSPGYRGDRTGLMSDLNLVARMIQADFGTWIFYLKLDGFDTHGDQRQDHDKLLRTLGGAIANFFETLKSGGHDKRVVLMTFSEFGRRVRENGSRGTDHGAGSCLFVAGPSVKGGLVGKHPSLKPADLDSGDVKFHTDFRRVYATLLDNWLGCDSRRVLGDSYVLLDLLKIGKRV